MSEFYDENNVSGDIDPSSLSTENSQYRQNEILDFTFRPIANKKQCFPALFGLLIVSACLVVASVASPLYKGIISLVAVVGLISVVYLFSRYIAPVYAYAVIHDSNGQGCFIVTKTIGKRVDTLFMIPLYAVISLKRTAQKTETVSVYGERKYNLCPSFSPKNIYAMRASTRYEKSLVLLELTDDVMNRLLLYVEIAKENEPEE